MVGLLLQGCRLAELGYTKATHSSSNDVHCTDSAVLYKAMFNKVDGTFSKGGHPRFFRAFSLIGKCNHNSEFQPSFIMF